MGLFMLNNFQDEEYPKPPKNNEDYDYWEGSFKGYSPKELLALSDEDLQTLFNEFLDKGLEIEFLDKYYTKYKNYLSNTKSNNNFNNDNLEEELSTQGGGFLRYILTKIIQGVKYTKDKEVQLFRSIRVNNTEEIDLNNLGVCWTYKSNNIPYLERIFNFYTGRFKVRFASSTPIDNIDWVNSLFLYLKHAFLDGNEDELRVCDPKKICLLGYVSIDSKTNTLYSKYGDVSNISKGIIQ